MAHSSWGPGWPNCPTGGIVTVVIHEGEGEIRLPVQKMIAPLVVALVRDLEKARNKRFIMPGCWGFACRPIRDTQTASNHSWGLAIDLDAPTNPMMSAASHAAPHSLRKKFDNGKTLRSTMPDNASKIAAKWGFRWGGDYTTTPDPMHFEFMGSREDAQRRVKELRVKEKKRKRREKPNV